jgi:hypothetical protein
MKNMKFFRVYATLVFALMAWFPIVVSGQAVTTDTIVSIVGADNNFIVTENYHTINSNMIYGTISFSLSSDTTNNLIVVVNDSAAGNGQKITNVNVNLPSGTKIWVVRIWADSLGLHSSNVFPVILVTPRTPSITLNGIQNFNDTLFYTYSVTTNVPGIIIDSICFDRNGLVFYKVGKSKAVPAGTTIFNDTLPNAMDSVWFQKVVYNSAGNDFFKVQVPASVIQKKPWTTVDSVRRVGTTNQIQIYARVITYNLNTTVQGGLKDLSSGITATTNAIIVTGGGATDKIVLTGNLISGVNYSIKTTAVNSKGSFTSNSIPFSIPVIPELTFSSLTADTSGRNATVNGSFNIPSGGIVSITVSIYDNMGAKISEKVFGNQSVNGAVTATFRMAPGSYTAEISGTYNNIPVTKTVSFSIKVPTITFSSIKHLVDGRSFSHSFDYVAQDSTTLSLVFTNSATGYQIQKDTTVIGTGSMKNIWYRNLPPLVQFDYRVIAKYDGYQIGILKDSVTIPLTTATLTSGKHIIDGRKATLPINFSSSDSVHLVSVLTNWLDETVSTKDTIVKGTGTYSIKSVNMIPAGQYNLKTTADYCGIVIKVLNDSVMLPMINATLDKTGKDIVTQTIFITNVKSSVPYGDTILNATFQLVDSLTHEVIKTDQMNLTGDKIITFKYNVIPNHTYVFMGSANYRYSEFPASLIFSVTTPSYQVTYSNMLADVNDNSVEITGNWFTVSRDTLDEVKIEYYSSIDTSFSVPLETKTITEKSGGNINITFADLPNGDYVMRIIGSKDGFLTNAWIKAFKIGVIKPIVITSVNAVANGTTGTTINVTGYYSIPSGETGTVAIILSKSMYFADTLEVFYINKVGDGTKNSISQSFTKLVPSFNPYWIKVTGNVYGKVTESQTISVYIKKPTGIENVSTEEIRIYPNPAVDHIALSTTELNVKYQIFSITGQLVKTGMVNGEEQINVSNLPKNCYVIKTEFGYAKFIKE